MIAQKKDPGKTGRGKTLFLPKSILPLGPRKIAYPECDRCVIYHTGGHQPKQCPSRLRRRAGRRTVASIIHRVTLAPFAPAAVRVLDAFKPGDGLLHLGTARIALDGIKRAKHRPGSVDVVHPPAAEPAAILLLGPKEIFDAARDRWLACRSLAELAQHGKTARRHIRGRRIEQRAVIRERDAIQILP